MAARRDPKEIAVIEMEAENGTRICFEAYLRRGGRTFSLSLHLEKWEHPDTIADYLRAYADCLTSKTAVVNDCELPDQ